MWTVDSLVQLPTSKPRLEQKLQLGEAQFGLDLCHIRKPCKHAGKVSETRKSFVWFGSFLGGKLVLSIMNTGISAI